MTIPTQAAELTITTAPTDADAQLMVQLAQLAQAMHVDRGSALLGKHRAEGGLSFEQFEATYPTASEEAIAIMNVLTWNETVGTLVKQGLLDRGLINDWLWVAGAWAQCRGIAIGQREQLGEACIWENFEALAAAQS